MIKRMLYLFCLLTTTFSWANSIEQQLIDCKALRDSSKRLICFDQIQLPAAQLTSELPQKTMAAKPQTLITEDDFGLEHRAAVKDKMQSSTTMVLKTLNKTAFGVLIFNFDNGQVWRQVSKETFPAKTGRTYILERGALNSFFLYEQGAGRKTRVRRDK